MSVCVCVHMCVCACVCLCVCVRGRWGGGAVDSGLIYRSASVFGVMIYKYNI